MIDYNQINNNLQREFVNNKGKGLVFAYPPLNIGNALLGTINRLINKRPDEKLLIIIGEYRYKEEILKSIKERVDLEQAVYIENHLQFLSQSYAFTKLYLYTVNILIGIEAPDFIKKSYDESRFTLCITLYITYLGISHGCLWIFTRRPLEKHKAAFEFSRPAIE